MIFLFCASFNCNMDPRNNSQECEAGSHPAATHGGSILGQVTTVGFADATQFPTQKSFLWYANNDENTAVVREVTKWLSSISSLCQQYASDLFVGFVCQAVWWGQAQYAEISRGACGRVLVYRQRKLLAYGNRPCYPINLAWCIFRLFYD